jgi:hypothetical protein
MRIAISFLKVSLVICLAMSILISCKKESQQKDPDMRRLLIQHTIPRSSQSSMEIAHLPVATMPDLQMVILLLIPDLLLI